MYFTFVKSKQVLSLGRGVVRVAARSRRRGRRVLARRGWGIARFASFWSVAQCSALAVVGPQLSPHMTRFRDYDFAVFHSLLHRAPLDRRARHSSDQLVLGLYPDVLAVGVPIAHSDTTRRPPVVAIRAQRLKGCDGGNGGQFMFL